MGRDAGWIAYAAGIAGGAHVVLVPEREIDIVTPNPLPRIHLL